MPPSWTRAARDELEAFVARETWHTPAARQRRSDELATGIARHAVRGEPVSPEAVRGFLDHEPLRLPTAPAFTGWVFGVALPILTLAVEANGSECRDLLRLDPIPTPWHVVAILLVPVAAVVGLWACRTPAALRAWWPGVVHGLATGIALVYAVGFLPLVPVGAMALLMGLGLFVLAPLLALWALLRLGRSLGNARWQLVGRRRVRGLWPGIVVGAAAVLALEVGLRRHWLAPRADLVRQLQAPEPALRAGALRALRTVAAADLGDILCPDAPAATGPAGWILGLLVDAVTEAGLSGPALEQATFRVRGMAGEWPDQLLRSAGLTLSSSQLDGSVDAEAGTAYLEWTLEFANSDARDAAEAILWLQLPPDSACSRLTLWVAGVESEAAWSERSTVRAAYDAVTRRQRDPALVTMDAGQRLELRVFPVPARGQARVKLGLTLALAVTADTARLALPELLDHSFALAPELAHRVAIDATSALAAPVAGLLATEARVTGALAPAAWAEHVAPAGIAWQRRGTRAVWSPAPARSPAQGVVCEFDPPPVTAGSVVLVVDRSAALRRAATEIRTALAALAAGRAVHILASDDEGLMTVAPAELPMALADDQFVGGRDNRFALLAAAALADPTGLVVWLHGAQPIELGPVAGTIPAVAAVALCPGSNALLRQLTERGRARSVPRRGPLLADLQRACAPDTAWTRRFRSVAGDRPQPPDLPPASDHLARLWALAEVRDLLAAGRQRAAVDLAVAHRLVTPVSGAVVLETRAQFQEHGLTPAAPDTVPHLDLPQRRRHGSAPEPPTVLLLLLAGVVFVVARAWRRRP